MTRATLEPWRGKTDFLHNKQKHTILARPAELAGIAADHAMIHDFRRR